MAEQAAAPAPAPVAAPPATPNAQPAPTAHAEGAPPVPPKNDTPPEVPWTKMGLVERKNEDGSSEWGREIVRNGKKHWLSPTKDPEAFWQGYDRGPEHSRLAKEAAEAKAQRDAWVADIVNGLKSDRVGTIAQLMQAAGEDPERGFMEILQEADRRAKLTDEQRKLEDYERADAARRQAEEAQRAEAQRQAEVAQTREYMTKINDAVSAGLKQSGLPMTEFMHHAVTTMLESQALRGQQLDLNAALSYARKVHVDSLRQTVPVLQDDELWSTLGDATIGRIIKMHAAKVGQKAQPMPTSPERQTPTSETTVEQDHDTRAARAARAMAKIFVG